MNDNEIDNHSILATSLFAPYIIKNNNTIQKMFSINDVQLKLHPQMI